MDAIDHRTYLIIRVYADGREQGRHPQHLPARHGRDRPGHGQAGGRRPPPRGASPRVSATSSAKPSDSPDEEPGPGWSGP